MKKIFLKVYVSFLMVLSFTLSSCDNIFSAAKYNDMKVSSIVSTHIEGFGLFGRQFDRTFDFENGKIIDSCIADEKDLDDDSKNSGLYNNPIIISTFSKEEGENL